MHGARADSRVRGTGPSDRKRLPMELPQDPVMLLGVINMKLRDAYPSLDALCDDLGLDRAALEARLAAAGFRYLPAHNRFS